MKQAGAVNATVKEGIAVVDLAGDITSAIEEEILSKFRELERGGAKRFLFTFDKATYINSSGLGIIIGLVTEAKPKRQKFAACGLSGHFQTIFEMIGLLDYITAYPTEERALKNLRGTQR